VVGREAEAGSIRLSTATQSFWWSHDLHESSPMVVCWNSGALFVRTGAGESYWARATPGPHYPWPPLPHRYDPAIAPLRPQKGIDEIPCLANGDHESSGMRRRGDKCMMHFIDLKKFAFFRALTIPKEGMHPKGTLKKG
jgi:hypothetical protein